jgi:cell wall-associated NlpC family hydrolase
MNELQTRIIAECQSWVGTPWRDGGSAVKGQSGGVDCSRFVYSVFRNVGLCGEIDFGVLPGIYCRQRSNRPLVKEWLENHSELIRFIPGGLSAIQPCDVVAMVEGAIVHHVGIIDADMLHIFSARVPEGVTREQFVGNTGLERKFRMGGSLIFRKVELC